MHGMSFACGVAERLPVRSSPFPLKNGGSWLAGPSARLLRLEPAFDDGLSLADRGCPFLNHPCQVNAPDLPLQRHTEWSFGIVRLSAPPPEADLRSARLVSTQPTRFPASIRRFRTRFGFHSAAWLFTQTASSRSTDLVPKSSPSESARLSFAPRNRF
jgi:hypothetical protein